MNLMSLATLSGFALEVYDKSSNFEKQFSYIKANNLNITTLTKELSKCFLYSPSVSRSALDVELVELGITNYFVLYTVKSTLDNFTKLKYMDVYTLNRTAEYIASTYIKEINLLCPTDNLISPMYIRIHLKSNRIINAIPNTVEIIS
jgi:hypothetical protein